MSAAGFRPAFQVPELYSKNRSLECLHAVVVAAQNVVIFPVLSPVAQQAQPVGIVCVVGHYGPAFAVGAQVFARIETEAAHIPDAADAPAIELRAVGLRGVLNHDEVAASR